MLNQQEINYFEKVKTPFYFYDMGLLQKSLFAIKDAADLYNFHLHYAVKANANERILRTIKGFGLGADCVSGNEIQTALNNGFSPHQIVFAGVGKTDDEIELAINSNIFSINCESVQELEVINSIAKKLNKRVRIALRINPNVDALTHSKITTGLKFNKFGISLIDVKFIIENINSYENLFIEGLHFHIGSQITILDVYKKLCKVVNDTFSYFTSQGVRIKHINLGGGLGINYQNPESQIPNFLSYFEIFKDNLNVPENVDLHFEPGRSIVGQCGYLISKILYSKTEGNNNTLIIDAGFTELLRPALYDANHKIVNLSSRNKTEIYDIAGPICETSDYFGRAIELPLSKRGDLIGIYSTGAYGEVMASQYNLRSLVSKYYSDEIPLLPIAGKFLFV
ncbi:MAG: diaminopimelate decarboxylase [Bacteroidales bacterium]|nr:diaminopimelate decarboxylase [Bacteroidales bacterium]